MSRNDEVVVWCLDTASLDAAARAHLAAPLSADERERCAALRRDVDRAMFSAAHGLLRHLLAREVDRSAASLRFTRTDHGRPALVDDGPWLSFNLSHSDGMVAVALSGDGDVGVDVEGRARRVDPLEIARAAFSDDEQQQVAALSGEAQRDAFFRLWTLKEAYCKARGLGLSLDPRSYGFSLQGGITFTPPRDDERRWRFFAADTAPRHALAVCVEVKSADDDVSFTVRDARLAL